MAKSKGVLLIDDYDGSTSLNCDPNLLTVVIRNILQNAIKFTESSKSIHFTVQAQMDEIVFVIKDKGVGMSQEQIQNIL